jgi:CHAT domain-containing protein
LKNEAGVFESQGRYGEALDAATRAAGLARQIGEPETLWKSLYAAGTAYRAQKDGTHAREAFEEAIAAIESIRTKAAGGEEQQQRVFESRIFPYHAMVDLLISEGRVIEAFDFAERAKGRVLLDVLQTGRVNIEKAMTVEERNEERRLNAALVSLNAQVVRESASPQADERRLAALKQQLEKARLGLDAFQTTLYVAHPELRIQRGEARTVRLKDVAELISTTTALLDYVVTEKRTFLFVITKKPGKTEAEIHAYTLPVSRDDFADQIEKFRQQLASRDLGFRASAKRLYTELLQPAQTQLRGKTNLIIAPDYDLWDLSFEALTGQDGRFLIEAAAVSYTPSLTVLRATKQHRDARSGVSLPYRLLAFGNPAIPGQTIQRAALTTRGVYGPLPEAEQEVESLREVYGSARTKIYVGAAAREDRAKLEASQAAILHFATHGVLDNASPMYSHLLLSPGDAKNDGLLEAWELMQLDLHADLAVLSACETARGRFGAGEGMIGLTWALFVGGVPSTVVSQWKVESASTRDLMLQFHRNLKTGSRKAEALRQAALHVLRSPGTQHPFYWAGFVLVGDN